MKRGKRRSAYARRTREWDYMTWTREQDCRVAVALGSYRWCRGRVHAHHAGARAFGRKAPDDTCIPLCSAHHCDLHDARGWFDGMGRAARRRWLDDQIAEMRAAYLASMGRL